MMIVLLHSLLTKVFMLMVLPISVKELVILQPLILLVMEVRIIFTNVQTALITLVIIPVMLVLTALVHLVLVKALDLQIVVLLDVILVAAIVI